MGLNEQLAQLSFGDRQRSNRMHMSILDKRDTIIEGPAQVGKTTALFISALRQVDPSLQVTQVVLSTSKASVPNELRRLATGVTMYDCAVDGDEVEVTANIVIGYPPFVLQLIKDGVLNVHHVKFLGIDDVDVILRKTKLQISTIFRRLPRPIQVCASWGTSLPALFSKMIFSITASTL
jgi:superfamily II DNA/RNA helicase